MFWALGFGAGRGLGLKGYSFKMSTKVRGLSQQRSCVVFNLWGLSGVIVSMGYIRGF